MVRSNIEDAKEAADNLFLEIEEDIYVTSVSYPSGVEFHIKTRSDTFLNSPKIIYSVKLKKSHKFATRNNAEKGRRYFEAQTGEELIIKRRYETIKGYRNVKYYYLCLKSRLSKQPCPGQ